MHGYNTRLYVCPLDLCACMCTAGVLSIGREWGREGGREGGREEEKVNVDVCKYASMHVHVYHARSTWTNQDTHT
jgi:hypothetical protein